MIPLFIGSAHVRLIILYWHEIIDWPELVFNVQINEPRRPTFAYSTILTIHQFFITLFSWFLLASHCFLITLLMS